MYFDFFDNDPFWGAQDYYAYAMRTVYWVIGLVIAAVVIGIILNFTFLKRSNEGKFKGFLGSIYNMFSMNRFHTEDIIKLLGIITFLMITFLGIFMIFSGSVLGGILLILFGNMLTRLCYELIIMFAILTRKTVSIDKKLAGIEKFYTDDMDDWEGSGKGDAEEDPADEIISDPDASFEDKLKAAFGDISEDQKYGYDEECRECDNWDEVSQDCYCEDDCLTCEKPDQDKLKAEAEEKGEVPADSPLSADDSPDEA